MKQLFRLWETSVPVDPEQGLENQKCPFFERARQEAAGAALNPKKFFQVHKAHIVNIDFVEKISPATSGNFIIQLNDSGKTKIPLSRRFARPVRDALRW